MGWILISDHNGIRVDHWEKSSKFNKRPWSFIRYSRVHNNQAWRLGNLGNQTKSGTKLGDLLDNAHSLLFNVTGKYTIFHEYYAWDNKFIWEKHLLEQKTSASVVHLFCIVHFLVRNNACIH